MLKKRSKAKRGERRRRPTIALPSREAQTRLPPDQVKVLAYNDEALNDYGAGKYAGEHVCPNAEMVFLSKNRMERLERTVWASSLRLLDLSFNNISELPDTEFWLHMPRLQVLYLHGNKIVEWNAILGLAGAKNLVALTMHGNGLCAHSRYRHFMVNYFSSLLCLDGNVVTDSEIIEGISCPVKSSFAPCTERTYVKRLYSLSDQSDAGDEEPKSPSRVEHGDARPPVEPQRVDVGSKTPKWILLTLERLLVDIRTVHQRCSAVSAIQRHFRGHLARRWVQSRVQNGFTFATKIQKIARGFLLRRRMDIELRAFIGDEEEDLLLSEHDRVVLRATKVIQGAWRSFRKSEIVIPTEEASQSPSVRTRETTTTAEAQRPSKALRSSSTNVSNEPLPGPPVIEKHRPVLYSPKKEVAYPPKVKVIFGNDFYEDREKIENDQQTHRAGEKALPPFELPLSGDAHGSTALNGIGVAISSSPDRPYSASDSITKSTDAHGTSTNLYIKGSQARQRPMSSSSKREIANLARIEKVALANKRRVLKELEAAGKFTRANIMRQERLQRMRQIRARKHRSNAFKVQELRQETEDRFMKNVLAEDQLHRQQHVENQRLSKRMATEARKEELYYKRKDQVRVQAEMKKKQVEAKQIIQRYEAEMLNRRHYKKARAEAVRSRRNKDRRATAKFARASVAMSRHLLKGSETRIKMVERARASSHIKHAQMNRQETREIVKTSLNKRWVDRARSIEQSKTNHHHKMAWRYEKDLQTVEMKKIERNLMGDVKVFNKLVRSGKLVDPPWPV
jgi:hypothetical protein